MSRPYLNRMISSKCKCNKFYLISMTMALLFMCFVSVSTNKQTKLTCELINSIAENCDPYKCPAEKVFRSNIMALENAIRDPRAQIGGLVVLLDMAGLRFAHAKFLSPHLAKRSADVIQDSFPMRFKAFHILHEPFYFDAILALIKPFMTEKIRNRVSLLHLTAFIFYFNILNRFNSLFLCSDSYAWKRSQISSSTHSKGYFAIGIWWK